MKLPTYSAEQILKVVEQADKAEQTVTSVCREHVSCPRKIGNFV